MRKYIKTIGFIAIALGLMACQDAKQEQIMEDENLSVSGATQKTMKPKNDMPSTNATKKATASEALNSNEKEDLLKTS